MFEQKLSLFKLKEAKQQNPRKAMNKNPFSGLPRVDINKEWFSVFFRFGTLYYRKFGKILKKTEKQSSLRCTVVPSERDQPINRVLPITASQH